MRRESIAVAALAAICLAGSVSVAYAKFVQISGTHSRTEIKSKCDAAGGTYTDVEGGKEYYCQAPSGNGVLCNDAGKCEGIVQMAGPIHNGETLLQFLTAPRPKAVQQPADTGTPNHHDSPPLPPATSGESGGGVILY